MISPIGLAPVPFAALLPGLPVLPPPEQREGLLQDGGFGGEAAAPDLLADEMLPVLG